MSDAKPKWTPGPWEAERTYQQSGAHYSWPISAGGRHHVAECSVIYPGDGALDVLGANAALIAAAPDLYEALATVRRSINPDTLGKYPDAEGYAVTLPARDWIAVLTALSKAEGRAQ